MPYIVVKQNANKCWYWTLYGANGEPLAHSEAYSSKAACLKTVKVLKYALNIEWLE